MTAIKGGGMTTRARRLAKAGYTVIAEVNTLRSTGRWFEVLTPGGSKACVGYQSAHCIHVFFDFEGTASGCNEATAHLGGLGDAIGTDAQLAGYKRLVLTAPSRLLREYDGLYRASSDAYNERH